MIQVEREILSKWTSIIKEIQDFIDIESGRFNCKPEFNHDDAVKKLESIVQEIKETAK